MACVYVSRKFAAPAPGSLSLSNHRRLSSLGIRGLRGLRYLTARPQLCRRKRERARESVGATAPPASSRSRSAAVQAAGPKEKPKKKMTAESGDATVATGVQKGFAGENGDDGMSSELIPCKRGSC